MGGALLQLGSYGSQDVYLTGNPQITFFKVVYRRHTNFSMECIQQTLNGNIGWGNTITSNLSKSGDLVYKMYLQWKKPDSDDFKGNSTFIIPHNFGHYMIDYVSIDMGGQEIDRQTGHWMEVYSRLNVPNNKKTIGQYSREMINLSEYVPYNPHYKASLAITSNGIYDTSNLDFNNSDNDGYLKKNDVNLRHLQPYNIQQNTPFQQMTGASGCNGCILNRDDVPEILQIPLQFWFCRNPGLALPIIALQYHDVKIKLKFQDQYMLNADKTSNALFPDSKLLNKTNQNVELWCEYIYLSDQERRRFAQVSHEYLIEQIQYVDIDYTKNNNSFKLDSFKHPIKTFIFSSNWAKPKSFVNYRPEENSRLYPFWRGGMPISASRPLVKENVIPGYLPCLGTNQTKLSLKINGNNRFDENKPWYYFSRYQTKYNYKGPVNLYSSLNLLTCGEGHAFRGESPDNTNNRFEINDEFKNYIGDSIGVYSFALKPDEHQPSGTCNFSRVDNCTLTIKDNYSDDTDESFPLVVYAINYNVLRIMSGMAGLAYSS
jgi:hypothetical protein